MGDREIVTIIYGMGCRIYLLRLSCGADVSSAIDQGNARMHGCVVVLRESERGCRAFLPGKSNNVH